jgi:hypothetical protein
LVAAQIANSAHLRRSKESGHKAQARRQRNSQPKEKKEEEFFTPYAPAVLTPRGSIAPIPLGCDDLSLENTVYASGFDR